MIFTYFTYYIYIIITYNLSGVCKIEINILYKMIFLQLKLYCVTKIMDALKRIKIVHKDMLDEV